MRRSASTTYAMTVPSRCGTQPILAIMLLLEAVILSAGKPGSGASRPAGISRPSLSAGRDAPRPITHAPEAARTATAAIRAQSRSRLARLAAALRASCWRGDGKLVSGSAVAGVLIWSTDPPLA
jgi:hypothetical protein